MVSATAYRWGQTMSPEALVLALVWTNSLHSVLALAIGFAVAGAMNEILPGGAVDDCHVLLLPNGRASAPGRIKRALLQAVTNATLRPNWLYSKT